ncbi:hypothetical protein LJK87_16005 [Paenibacillus sp. P25]|nr:hypothetical protein LJK87_16005 [Paenibacillus sp. P25]
MAIIQKAQLDPGVANTIIETWIAKDWQDAEAKKAGADQGTVEALTEQQSYYNWPANERVKHQGN